MQTTRAPATIDDLDKVEGKAELIGGRIVHFMANGFAPSRVAFKIALRLEFHAMGGAGGFVFSDGMGYALDLPLLGNGRQSFSPDASYYVGPEPSNPMRFIERIPALAVEVRGENDYGPAPESEMQAKRADYFEAGTQVVWDVDPMARTVASYRGNPSEPTAVYRAGQVADAEPAVPGWRLAVDDLFG